MRLDKSQRWIILGAIIAFLLMGFFPPWKHGNGEPAGHAFITNGRAHLDFGRLVLQWLLLAGCVGAVLWAAKAFDLSVWPSVANKWLGPPATPKPVTRQPLCASSVLEIRFSRASGIVPMLFGVFSLAFPFAFIYGTIHSKESDWSLGAIFGALLVLVGFPVVGFLAFRFGWRQAFDKSVKLSLTDNGLKDYRTGEFVRWSEFRGVRLFVRTTNGHLTAATMYVKIADGHEIAFEVCGLERTHDEIAQLVHQRGIAWREARV